METKSDSPLHTKERSPLFLSAGVVSSREFLFRSFSSRGVQPKLVSRSGDALDLESKENLTEAIDRVRWSEKSQSCLLLLHDHVSTTLRVCSWGVCGPGNVASVWLSLGKIEIETAPLLDLKKKKKASESLQRPRATSDRH